MKRSQSQNQTRLDSLNQKLKQQTVPFIEDLALKSRLAHQAYIQTDQRLTRLERQSTEFQRIQPQLEHKLSTELSTLTHQLQCIIQQHQTQLTTKLESLQTETATLQKCLKKIQLRMNTFEK